jgi:molecular chaperone HscB
MILILSGRILDTLKEIEDLVGNEDIDKLHHAATRLKYLQGIEQAAQSWPNPPFDH